MGVTADLQPSSNLQSEDYKELRNALRGMSCNEKRVIEILCRRNQAQRDGIAEGYKLAFGESLHKRLKSATSGKKKKKLEKCLSLWMTEPSERDAVLLYEALRRSNGGPKKDRAVVGTLCTRTPGQINQIKQAYYTLFNRTLENHIDGSSTFESTEPQTKIKWAFWRSSSSEPRLKDVPPQRAPAITKLMIALARGSRPVSTTVDRQIALTDAHQLNKVCTGKLGDEETLIRILTTRSSYQLTATLNYYQQHYGHDFEMLLSKKDAGEFLQAVRVVVQCFRQPTKFYVEELVAALSEAGPTNEETLIWIIITRAEVDMQSIKLEFLNERKKSLEDTIANATTGTFRQFLLTVVSQDNKVIAPLPTIAASNNSRQASKSSQIGSASCFSSSLGSNNPKSF